MPDLEPGPGLGGAPDAVQGLAVAPESRGKSLTEFGTTGRKCGNFPERFEESPIPARRKRCGIQGDTGASGLRWLQGQRSSVRTMASSRRRASSSGVASANASGPRSLVAGVAGLVAGAFSMAAGEYVSVSSRSTPSAQIWIVKHEARGPAGGRGGRADASLCARGLEPDLARKVAQQLMAKDALAARARRTGLTEELAARPLQAAIASAATFAVGAAVPVLAIMLAPMNMLVACDIGHHSALSRGARCDRGARGRRDGCDRCGTSRLLGCRCAGRSSQRQETPGDAGPLSRHSSAPGDCRAFVWRSPGVAPAAGAAARGLSTTSTRST